MRQRLTSNSSIEKVFYILSYEIKKISRLQLGTCMNISYAAVIGIALRERYRGKGTANGVSVVSARAQERNTIISKT